MVWPGAAEMEDGQILGGLGLGLISSPSLLRDPYHPEIVFICVLHLASVYLGEPKHSNDHSRRFRDRS